MPSADHGTALRVLAYHAITALPAKSPLRKYGVPAADFRAQIDQLLRANYSFIDAELLLSFLDGRTALPPKAVLVTFDDCHESVEHAAEILQSRGVRGAAFVVSASLDGCGEHFGGLGPQLNTAGLKRLVERGLEIGAHSHTHPFLTRLSASDLWAETAGAINRLRSADLGPIRIFAYPYGAHDHRVRDTLRRAGASAAFTIEPGFVTPQDDRLCLSRIQIEYGETGLAFRAKVEAGGGLSRVRARFRVRSRVSGLLRQSVPRLRL